ncbi:MAG TPA: TlpA disulfide reductase family protein [Longimicrobiales bacterium]|nr:TlpA disulfide reductase family protein [Longimicrobiales bacterium]
MKARKAVATTAIVAVMAVLSGLIWVNRARFAPLDVGSRAPDYEAFTLDGDTVPLSSYRGNVVLLNVWATWCRPCVKEMPAMERLHQELKDQGLRVVAVSVDAPSGGFGDLGQPGGDVRAFAEQLGLTFDILHDPSGRIQNTYQVHGLPSTFLIDREGRIQQKVLGPRDWDVGEDAASVRALLDAP